ncbi:hypothetical protein C8A03DRAFT_34282 [Achaetomium macrosporum]|uniref:Uncharacterized protein n=1 Tax=Achaetomium macrosporum TaxID=79813 RepID=A0AAN7CAD5_9PEZI|nr:hypothetical protein C8A03DRAFT_34282 [Achaetomium macrosporum]
MFTTVTVGGTLAKRLVQDPAVGWKLPSWIGWLFLGDVLLFLPIFLIMGYTFQRVYPTLAAVEDPLPAYEAVPMNDDDDTPKDDNDPVRPGHSGKPITSSLRATNRLLRSIGGWLSNFRGFGAAFAISVVTFMIVLPFYALIPIIPVRCAHLLALYILTPWSVTWTHVVITPESSESFFRRLVPFRRAYVATWFPTFLLWAATHLSVILPSLLARAIGLEVRDPFNVGPAGLDVAKTLCVAGVSLALQALLVIPAHTALVRVQASLLPADEDTIVPFDRSFGGRVAPEIVTGKGFASFTAALATVSWASWLRIYLLRIKVFAMWMAMYMVLGAIVVLQVFLFSIKCDTGEGANGYKCY